MRVHRVKEYEIEVVHIRPDEKRPHEVLVSVLARKGEVVVNQIEALPANDITREFLQAIIPGGRDIPVGAFADVMHDIRSPP